MVDAGYMADQVADAFGGPSFTTLMTLLVLILLLWVAAAGALGCMSPLSRAPADVRHAYDSMIAKHMPRHLLTEFPSLRSICFLEGAEPEGADDPHRRSQQRRQDGALYAGMPTAALIVSCSLLRHRQA